VSKKVSIVTGSTSGIGWATAELLLEQGHRVMFNARSPAARPGLLEGFSSDDAAYCGGDIASEADATAIVDRTVERWGRLDHLVNNAGRTVFIPHGDLAGPTAEVWHDMFSTNVVGTWNMIKFAAPHLARSGGAIVNVASMAGVTAGDSSSIPYAVSKAGVVHLTRLMARTLAPNVRVNAVAPGLVRTPWHDSSEIDWEAFSAAHRLGRYAVADDIATVISQLLGMSYVTGEVIRCDGGNSLG
jgi:ketoreductase RED2